MDKRFHKGGFALYYGTRVRILQCNSNTATVLSPNEKKPFACSYCLLTPLPDEDGQPAKKGGKPSGTVRKAPRNRKTTKKRNYHDTDHKP